MYIVHKEMDMEWIDIWYAVNEALYVRKEDRRSSLEILLTRDTDNTRAHFIFFERERFLGMSSVWKNVFCYLTKYFIALPPTIYAKWLGDVRCAICDMRDARCEMRNAMCVLSPISSGAVAAALHFIYET